MPQETTAIFHSGKLVPDGQPTTRPVRIAIEVVAGIVPGTPIHEHTKRFYVFSDDWHDREKLNTLSPFSAGDLKTMATYGEAMEYMRTLWNPGYVNWVKCEWIYF